MPATAAPGSKRHSKEFRRKASGDVSDKFHVSNHRVKAVLLSHGGIQRASKKVCQALVDRLQERLERVITRSCYTAACDNLDRLPRTCRVGLGAFNHVQSISGARQYGDPDVSSSEDAKRWLFNRSSKKSDKAGDNSSSVSKVAGKKQSEDASSKSKKSSAVTQLKAKDSVKAVVKNKKRTPLVADNETDDDEEAAAANDQEVEA